MPKVFLSYRRDDTEYVVPSLHEKLTERFGRRSVFVDVDEIPSGGDFREHLARAVGECDIVLAVIGKQWLNATDDAGRKRLELPNDWVRIEIESALERKVPVIPLLVGGASIPAADTLPESLRELAYRQALPLRSGRDFQRDLDLLASEIARTRAGARRTRPWRRMLGLAMAVVPVAALAVLGGWAGITRWRNRDVAPVTTESVPPPAAAPDAPLRGAAMVTVPEGPFFMGCNAPVDDHCTVSEKPGRAVDIASFRIDRTEATVAEYAACVEAGTCETKGLSMPNFQGSEAPQNARFCNWGKSGRADHPINCLTWAQARTYCIWAGKRLPTEAEWEKAARGTDKRIYPWGNDAPGKGARPVANVADARLYKELQGRVEDGYDDGWAATAPVGSYPAGASPYGAQDTAGNVSEWVENKDEGENCHFHRGGGWDSPIWFARASFRGCDYDYAQVDVGVRCAK